MSNRVFQGIIHQTKEAINRTVGVIDESMTIIACSNLTRIGEPATMLTSENFTVQEPVVLGG